MNFLEVKNLGVRFNSHVILDDVSFEIAKGDVVSIIGPNGSGKTTMVRAMLGLVEHSGQIFLEGKNLREQTYRVGYVPQRFDFDRTFPISVKEFLRLSVAHPDSAWYEEVCREFSIAALMKNKLGTLSGGQMQRVLIASALLKKPELLILDEPTSGVDLEGTASFYELVRHENEVHNITIFLISHEVNMVFHTSTKVICLNKALLGCGEPHTVITKELLEKLYSTHFEMRNHDH
jgi:zinc transport system ATP-binding protein